MSRVLTNEKNYYDIADTIRQMKDVDTTYKPREMASALKDIYSNEVEGTLPLSFEANGNNLLNYRIDGASGGVGERTKNLLQNTATTQTKNGVTFTVNEDKSISCNGTATSNAFFKIGDIQLKKNCIMSGCPEGGANNSYVMRLYNNGSVFKTDSGDGVLINSEVQNGYVEIRIAEGYTCDNLTFYPMIRLAEIEDNTYEPYGYKVPVVINGKNLFDGIYGANHFSKIEPDKTITISTKSTGESSITFVYKKSDGTRFRYTRLLNENETSGSVTVTTPSEAVGIGIYAATDYTSQTMIYDTLIEYGDTATTYEEYISPTTTNIYLDEPIEARANIPNEYEEVEYLESTGTQYINTGFKLNTNCRIVFDYYLTDLVSFSPFGSYQTQNQIGFTAYTTDNTSRFGTFVTRRMTGNYNNYQINNRAHFEYSKNGLYQNGSLVYSITTNDVVSNYNCFIFARNVDDVATGFGNIRLYYFKIYNNDSLVRNLIPCYRKSDNVAGLYDLVNSTFYTNEGTGNFIVGPIKENESISLSDTEVDIPTIEGTNTLTIDTTVQPSNVYVQAPKDSIEATQIANELEEI